ncbi:MAG: hypothetical protein ACE5GH_02035 [Fidelibacterota bacterium]
MKKKYILPFSLLLFGMVACTDFPNPLSPDGSAGGTIREQGSGNSEHGSGNSEHGSGNSEHGSSHVGGWSHVWEERRLTRNDGFFRQY